MKRRDFIKMAGCFVATAKLGGIAACGSDGDDEDRGPFRFPQGVASGDPRPDAVMLWTRIGDATGTVRVRVEMSRTESFDELILAEEVRVTAASDHTVRILAEGLEADTIYYYRFVAGGQPSPVGRTWTAPAADAAVNIHCAWVSCQDYESGFHGAYRKMIRDDEAAPNDRKIRFVVHLGDFIYETRASGFQTALDENFEPIELRDRNGNPRRKPAFPDGGTSTGGENFAVTLDDYRQLYQLYLSDPDLQAARARWPFICVWDDHEFTNDSWQTQANFESDATTNEPSQRRKVASNQAWFEYVPAILTDAEPVAGVAPEARDFAAVEVEDTPYSLADTDENGLVTEPNNLAAIGSLTIYRALRFGRHLDLVLTDLRSYRSDHAVPEELSAGNALFFDPRNAISKELVNTLDAGETANGGNPPARILNFFDNPRTQSPPGSMLGAAQKAWWKATMRGSDATWKLWGSSVPVTRIFLNTSVIGLPPFDLILTQDAWDGYNTERKELMRFLLDEGVGNVVSIAGDHHAHFASVIDADFDADVRTPVMTELTVAGISSSSQFSIVANVARRNPIVPAELLALIFFDDRPFGGTSPFTPNLNTSILHGAAAAGAAATTYDRAEVEAAAIPVNPHMRFADTHSHGYGLLSITGEAIVGTLVAVPQPVVDHGEDGPPLRYLARFTIPRRDAGAAEMSEPEFEGAVPFPFSLE